VTGVQTCALPFSRARISLLRISSKMAFGFMISRLRRRKAQVLSAPVASTWALRLLSREIMNPNAIFDEMRNKEMRARASILQSIVSELTGLPAAHPAVTRCCINIMAPFGILLLIGPRRVERTFPILSFGPESVEENTHHMVEFALGGLAAVARYQNTQ